ncbi:MAG: hypothetical protein LUH04_07860 [Clostridium sp.]|nr:hypothetical protein [Clostridium sp.]
MKNIEGILTEIMKKENLSEQDIFIENGIETVTWGDFIKKIRFMTPWHRNLIENLSYLMEKHGNVVGYLKHYAQDKLDNGFSFASESDT